MGFFDNNRRNYLMAACLSTFTGVALTLPLITSTITQADILQTIRNSKALDTVEHALRLDREVLTPSLLNEEIERGNLSKLRVHLSDRLIVVRETAVQETSHDVSESGIDSVTTQDRHTEVYQTRFQAEIVGVEGTMLTIRYQCEPPRSCELNFVSAGDRFVLADVPVDPQFDTIQAFIGTLGLIREDLGSTKKNLADLLKREIHLRVNKDTLTQINRTRERIEGVR